ncbi:hypothetical protein GS399_15885 [Pedobacter sp. HMF7647]|uniref:Cthe-2314-like HEPN domain-containing protein n=1 Tax=Hufsiella arboris TaxID=2695275 RepID=A0A7K1YCZ2_9SPHI|nr:Cthe_2314 family HEPN domain-containing protein [Hufsiella arboris]MXV52456.1 hypothetical protein [Hufsiella arboris]
MSEVLQLTDFLQQLAIMVSDMIKKVDTSSKAIHGFTPNRPLLKQEKYLLDCFLASAELEDLIKQLNTSGYLLANFRNTNTLKKNNISRFEYIIYHIEGHLLRVTGVIDRLLILVNHVLQIGLANFCCKPHFMLKNKKNKKALHSAEIEKVPLLHESLFKLSAFVDQFRDERNSIAHSKKITYQDLREIELYHLLIQTSTNPKIDKLKIVSKRKTDIKVSEYKEAMLKCNQEIKDLITPIYGILLDQFHKRHFELTQVA